MKETNADFWKRDLRFILPTYGERNIAFSRGEGAWLYDVEGRKYLDFLSGIGVNILGYSHPCMVRVIKDQAEKLLHTSNLYLIPNQIKLAETLVNLTFPGKCFFCNSGTEAIESAIKLAKKWGKEKGKWKIVSMLNSFHGRTCGSLSLTGQEKYQSNFLPLLPGVEFVPFNDLNALKSIVDSSTCAIIIEPVQGEGGIHVAQAEFLRGAREIAEKEDCLLIFDEVQCGMGRTGSLFTFQKFGVLPDVLCLAKGLAGGIPIGAIVVGEKAVSAFQPGDHASTFGGNPLATRVACEVLRILLEEEVVENARIQGERILSHLFSLKDRFSFIKEIRGIGLMLGVEIEGEASKIRKFSQKKGVLIGTAGNSVIRLLPPLIIKEEEINFAMKVIEESFEEFGKGNG